MPNDGRRLEELIASIEGLLLPAGFHVSTNRRIFDNDGAPMAEFDVEISGKVGSTEFTWLIECRDRPSSGAAPSAWIEQLVGRRSRFGFAKVTAVSTTGFSASAIEYAQQTGIELRVIESLDPSEFLCWVEPTPITQILNSAALEDAHFVVSDENPTELLASLRETLAKVNGDTPVLRSVKSGEIVSVANAFLGAVQLQDLFSKLNSGDPPQRVKLRVVYTNDEDHFIIDTEAGSIRVTEIAFRGRLTTAASLVLVSRSEQYLRVGSGEPISEFVAYDLGAFNGSMFSLELHRIADTGATHLMLRNVGRAEGT